MTTPLFLALILAITLVGGLLPLAFRWSERHLHLALGLTTGTFLGAVFLHLLPDLSAHRADDGDGHGSDTVLWLCVLGGVLLVHLVEAIYLRTTERDDEHRHRSVGLVTIAAVSVHAFTAGLGLAALDGTGRLSLSFQVAFLAHKAFEAFAVVNVFLLAQTSRPRLLSIGVLFALVTPAGMLLGSQVLSDASLEVLDVVTALATGTFLYVSVAELLPEVFHHRGDNLAKSLFLVVGVALSLVFENLGG